MQDINRLITFLENKGAVSSLDIQTGLGFNQPKISRLIKQAGTRIIRIGHARTAKYAISRPVLGHKGSIPVYTVDEKGQPQHLFNLHGLGGGQCYVETEENTPWLNANAGNGVFEGLPYFVDDLRPQGFLGRKAATHYAKRFGFPETLDYWSESQIGTYLLKDGHNLPGNLILGDIALQAFQRDIPGTITDRETSYPNRASSILNNWQEGSSTGGEHQKFIAHTHDKGHVIVKFSPAGNTIEAQRWQDLLICEYHALNTMRQAKKNAAKTERYKFDGRIFLESQRFDRTTETGRVSMISLSAIDNEFIGSGGSWTQVSLQLYKKKLITENDHRTCVWNDFYGQWTGNNDRHLGNLSMTTTGNGFKLLPSYDMLPMIYAPERGEIIERSLNTPIKPMKQYIDLWHESAEIACIFWRNIEEDKMISNHFRKKARDNIITIKRII